MKFYSICFISFFPLIFLSLFLFSSSLIFMLNNQTVFLEWLIITLNSTDIMMTVLLDWMSLLFMSFVLFISSLVVFYSSEYMEGDENINRFILLVLMFVFSMMMLIISPNIISILLGWDGLGLVSYCLVIYFQNVKSYSAGMLTALSNRIGDVALLISIAWMMNFGGWSFIFYLDYFHSSIEMTIIGWLVMIAAMTKSAQIPFSSWLPAAMAAPTPVSALVHSSTLVTAGVYLLIRFHVVISSSMLGAVLLFISGLTMFMAGLGANYEYDLKKIIALSTLSQLGLMMSVLAVGFYKLAFFHLLTHALFKALLFLCAGAVIHNMGNFQDIRFMGGVSLHMPFTLVCMNIANLALCGMPFLAGFYSKDLILEMVSLSSLNMFSYFLFFFSTGLTVAYSFRLVYLMSSGPFNSFSLNFLSDESSKMKLSMMVLTFMSILMGSMLMWIIFPSPPMICLPVTLKLMTLLVCILGGLLGYSMSMYSLYSESSAELMDNFSSYAGSMWFMPYISTYGMIRYPLLIGSFSYKIQDQGWSEEGGGQSLISSLENFSKILTSVQNNNLKIILLSFVLWVSTVVIIFCFS